MHSILVMSRDQRLIGEFQLHSHCFCCTHRFISSRTDLRDILLDSLQPDTIQWNHQLVSAESLPSSSYRLHFANAPSVTADIVIGADGTWSRIRPLLTPAAPIYSGITFTELVISDVDARFPHLASLVGDGLAFIMSDNKGFIPQRNSNHLIRVYVALRVPETWLDEHPLPANAADARQFLLSLFPGWDTTSLDLIKQSDSTPMTSRKIYAFPPSHSWSTELKGITLLGDAAHVMSPFAGEGVNLALMDAYELGRELIAAFRDGNSMDSVDKGLRTFEKSMLLRAAEKAEESAKNLDALFATSAPAQFVEIVKSFGPPPPSS
jgi:2-polyprenyl-6-methoxyphenol hydroxylase-like FAD-dependent oxidoreductase